MNSSGVDGFGEREGKLNVRKESWYVFIVIGLKKDSFTLTLLSRGCLLTEQWTAVQQRDHTCYSLEAKGTIYATLKFEGR